MNILLVGLLIVGGLVALYLLVFRRTTSPEEEGRPDRVEPKELTGPDQHQRREMP